MKDDFVLKVENLNVSFGEEKVIENLSFKVKRGDFYIILGPNGAGKTTLFRALLGLIPYEGKIAWAKKDVKISYLPERLSRSEFRKLPISVSDFYKFKERSREAILKMMRMVGLNDEKILKRNPGELSSGQFQRMLIGWTLLGDPEVLLFDEPATGIDIGGTETIYSLLGKIWQERELTVLLITHDLNIVYALATNVLCLHKGVLCSGPPREVLSPEVLEKLYGSKIKFYTHTH
ncbi:metal ABC transporter ATP-binding protein [bacterium]|nr:metal ABC transporter ATP-binding protein [bacterium]